MAGEFLDPHVGNLSPTPVLDGLEPPPEPKQQTRMGKRTKLFLLLLIGMAIGIGAASIPGSPDISFLWFLLFVWAGVAFHEAGHAIAGAITGFLFKGITVSGFTVVRTVEGWRLVFNWKQIIGGGRAYMFAGGPVEDWKYAVMVGGGPAASFAFLAAVWLFPWSDSHGTMRYSALLASGLLAAGFFYPKVGATVSDISLLWMLARKNADWRRLKILLPIQTLNIQGVRPRDWDRDALNAAIDIEGGNAAILLSACALRSIAAIDRDDIAEAADTIEQELRFSDRLPDALRSAVYLMAAEFQALYRRNATLARAWFERARSIGGPSPATLSGIEAAVLYAEGSFDRVVQKTTPALAQLRKSLGTAGARLALGKLEELVVKSVAAKG